MDIFDQLEGTIEAPAKPRRFVFVLLEEFTMLCFSAAVESLRIANRMSGQELYTWALISEDGAPVRCSAGIEFVVQHELFDVLRDDTAHDLRRREYQKRVLQESSKLAAPRVASRALDGRAMHGRLYAWRKRGCLMENAPRSIGKIKTVSLRSSRKLN